ncbi:Fumitremorgin C synthase [Metarhizium brunneum]|uniref:Fumitremorgin C synthase n=1 Tax=Metarhizium brunneum TaxID=500148 RepID=A0A7D5YVA1_9HYPO
MALIYAGVALVLLLAYFYNAQSKLPPGPSAIQLLASMLLSRNYIWKQFQQWHKNYGPVICLRIGQVTIISIGDRKAAHAILNRRSPIYSSRPRMVVAGECITKGLAPVLAPYGPQWIQFHKIHTTLLNARRCRLYRPLQELESRHLLFNLLSSNDFQTEFHRYASSLMYSLVYGKRFVSADDPELKEIRHMVDVTSQAISFGTWIVDIFPIFNCLPRSLAKWKRVGDDIHNRQTELFQQNTTAALNRPSWNLTKHCMLEPPVPVSPKEYMFVLAEFIEGGSDTTAAALMVSMLACVTRPAAMHMAQEELDKVVGDDRLPSFDDLPNLPYMTAFVEEVLRWRSLTPAGVAHAPIRDDTYNGYSIPKGTCIIANHWSLDMDDDAFANPQSFVPERWIDNPKLQGHSAFGFGKRSCPGQHLARASLLLGLSRLFWAYDITWKQDQGCSPEAVNMINGAVSRPASFEAVFTIRSPARRRVVEEQLPTETELEPVLDSIHQSICHE